MVYQTYTVQRWDIVRWLLFSPACTSDLVCMGKSPSQWIHNGHGLLLPGSSRCWYWTIDTSVLATYVWVFHYGGLHHAKYLGSLLVSLPLPKHFSLVIQSTRHQFLRRTFETSNSLLVRLTGVNKGTLSSRYLQLYNGFFVSGLIHHVGSLNAPFNPVVMDQFWFFMLQPVAITIEDFAIYVGKKANIKDSWKTRALGYAYVGAVLSFTLRYATNFFFGMNLGTARHPIIAKLSIMDRVFG